MISYNRLWETMRKKGVTQYTLIRFYRISPAQITRLKRNESVSTHTIDIFCKILDCRVEDIMEYIPSEGPKESPPSAGK
ncbi:MAG: helix-turn-helix transcriptional regulator [Clostridiales bacterium]|nr:helix-turn-helix transcriptional regulator [Clostridiales bacterium]